MIKRFMTYMLAMIAMPMMASAESLLPASIDFSDSRLWGLEVCYGLTDEGTYSGDTYWYTDDEDEQNVGKISQKSGSASGYLTFDTQYGLHRGIAPTTKSGVRDVDAESFAERPIYFDAEMDFPAYVESAFPITNSADRIICWVSQPDSSKPNRLMLTAGEVQDDGSIVRRDYETTVRNVSAAVKHRLTVCAYVNEEGVAGFNVYFDSKFVSALDGSGTFFPSLKKPIDAAYSFGVYGSGTLSFINFTRKDPIANPDYAKSDLSSLRQGTIITVNGYAGNAALTNFPLLVRISEELITNFRYRYVAAGGTNLRFSDENGKVLPFEVDTWDTSGESLVWVKVPYLVKGTQIQMQWDQAANSQLPANVSTDVWSDYVAVWHMNEENWAKDSSGHNFHARLNSTNAVQLLKKQLAGESDLVALGAYGVLTNAELICSNFGDDYPLNGNYTFTGWYRLDNAYAGKAVASMKAGTEVSASTSTGWCMADTKPSEGKMTFYGDGGNGLEVSLGYDITSEWGMFAMAHSKANRMNVYGNGDYVNGATIATTSTTNRFRLAVDGAALDEIRISKICREDNWIRAEYDQATNRNFAVNNGANSKTNYNFWVEEPSVSPSAWMPGEYQESFFNTGKARYGVVIEYYYDAFTGAVIAERPTDTIGSYRVVFSADDGRGNPLKREFYFVIYESGGYQQLEVGRVMLFNSDTAEACPVTYQGYYDLDANADAVWSHNSTTWPNGGDFKYVQRGDMHSYFAPGMGGTSGVELWRFEHARIGNLYPNPTDIYDGMNLLPWSNTSRRVLDSEKPCDSQEYAGTLILQNISLNSVTGDETPAAAYSPHFTNGVGEVYFDAVNAFGGYRNVLKVQKRMYSGEEWTDCKAQVYAIVGGVYDLTRSTNGVTEIVMDFDEAEGANDRFYRIIATVDEPSDVEIRIVRADEEARGWADDPDGEGLILIDNIVVAPCSMSISLSQYGAPADETLPVFRGQRAPFSVAFPSTNDIGSLRGAVKVNYDTSYAASASAIGALTMNYRWRYLNQSVDDWREMLMTGDSTDPSRFLSIAPLEADGVGDIEYYFRAIVNVPFYDFYDYTGLGLKVPTSSRQREAVLSAATEGMYKYQPSPSLGTNFFVRIRDGASDYEGFRLEVREIGSTTVKTVNMELLNDHTWRGFYQTLASVDAGIEYRLISMNRQSTVMTDYQFNTNYYHSTSVAVNNFSGVPFSGTYEQDDGTKWTTLPCDAVTGYLMFQINDQMQSMAIIHADYQNFNFWSDAYSTATNAYFTATSTSLPTSGVSSVALELSEVFNRYTETSPSNGTHWIECFGTTASTDPDDPFALNISFNDIRKTPNGWRAQLGKWVSENYGQVVGYSISLQLRREGLGRVYPVNLDARGIDTFKFSARIAQTYDIHSFNYYTGTTNDVYSLSDYAFGVLSAMEANGTQFAGAGSLSVVGHFRDSKGGYEARLERYSETEVKLALYKWAASGQPTCLGVSDVSYVYKTVGASGVGGNFAGLFITCSNNVDGSVVINAGVSQAAIATGGTAMKLFGGNRKYYCISYIDSDEPFHNGTFGVGCNNCQGTFARPQFLDQGFARLATAKEIVKGTFYRGECSFNSNDGVNLFPISKSTDDYDPSVYDEWNVYAGRIGIKDFTNDVPKKVYGFVANVPKQYLQVETSPRGLDLFTSFTNITIESFSLQPYAAVIRDAEDLDIQLRTSDDVDGYDIVVDDLELTQWRGENYDTEGNLDRLLYDQTGPHRLSQGAPTNFVYTTAWIGSDSLIELSPIRATSADDHPQGVRGPLFDGTDGRGIGLGQFGFRYYHADRRARLLLQIAKNVDIQNLPTITKSIGNAAWETVYVFDFSECTDAELEEGSCSYYVGEHGVAGVMRVIMDPEVVDKAGSTDPEDNPDRDPAYGRIYIVSAMAKDNPAIDTNSWWGWNLRTAKNGNTEGPFGEGDGLMQLLGDGYIDGLSYALNNSVLNDIKPGDNPKAHMPFLQSPVFSKSGIGEVTFKARRYSSDSGNPTLVIYGTHSYDPAPDDSEFEIITNITVTCDRFENFRVQAPVNSTYTGFRFAITGVSGVTGEKGPWLGDGPQRILLDEVVIYEAVLVRIGFRNTGCFRTRLEDNVAKSPFPVKSEQPICGEQWGFQTEIFATSLSNELDLDTPGREPHVYVHWFEGKDRDTWGYTNWMNHANANHGELVRADGSSLIFRSGLISSPDAVVQAATNATVVQYAIDVVFYMRGQDTALTNWLSVADWEKPEWYNPVDYNAEYTGHGFSAYNIVDTVSPGWAWINEVQLFGTYDSNYINSDKDYQYLEIAAPATADLTDWEVRFLVPRSGSNEVRTNTVATFGYDNLEGTKRNLTGNASGMVFRVIASAPTRSSGKLKIDDGDGYWSFPEPDGSILKATGEVAEDGVFGMQLVRPTGVVEHEIVVLGTNFWLSMTAYPEQYDPSNTVNFLNKYMSGANFFYVGKDDLSGAGYSLDVWTNRGENAYSWTNEMLTTPGRINEFPDGRVQYLDPNGPPTPLGTSIYIWSTIVTPHMYQTCGDVQDSTAMQILLVQKQSKTGTNILYKVDNWYEVDKVMANGVEVPVKTNGLYSYSVNVGADTLENIRLEASARISRNIYDLIPETERRYLPAIEDWFNRHCNVGGVEWPESADGKVHLAKCWPYYFYRQGKKEHMEDLTLTEMYWLDMCPTITDEQYLVAGFTGAPGEVTRTEGSLSFTNRQVSVFMMITNGLGLVEAGITNTVYSPYVTRALDPNVTSWDFAEDSSGWYDGWSNATFKISGILRNGLTRCSNPTNWVPLRLFVFHTNSFYRVGCKPPHAAYTTEIEFDDPYSANSWGYRSGWGDWMKRYEKGRSTDAAHHVDIWHRWSLDEMMPPVEVEILKPNNYFE